MKTKNSGNKMSPSVKLYIINLISYLQIVCDALSLVNGQIDYSESALTTGEYPVDTVATFTCADGFRLSGFESSICQMSGQWMEQNQMCNVGKEQFLQ